MRSAGGALDFSRVDGVPFKVTLLNTPHLLRKAARFARARFARASRAFYLVNSIYPRQWGQVSLRSGPAFLLFFTQIPHRLRWRLMGGPQQR